MVGGRLVVDHQLVCSNIALAHLDLILCLWWSRTWTRSKWMLYCKHWSSDVPQNSALISDAKIDSSSYSILHLNIERIIYNSSTALVALITTFWSTREINKESLSSFNIIDLLMIKKHEKSLSHKPNGTRISQWISSE